MVRPSTFAGVIFFPRRILQSFWPSAGIVSDHVHAGVGECDADALAVAQSPSPINDQAISSVQALDYFDEVAIRPTELHGLFPSDLVGKIGNPYVRVSLRRFHKLLGDH